MEKQQHSTPLIWRFVRHYDGVERHWLWQLFEPDGRCARTSAMYESYGTALADAIGQGFRPTEERYSIDLPHGRIHFPPGRDPEFEFPERRKALRLPSAQRSLWDGKEER